MTSTRRVRRVSCERIYVRLYSYVGEAAACDMMAGSASSMVGVLCGAAVDMSAKNGAWHIIARLPCAVLLQTGERNEGDEATSGSSRGGTAGRVKAGVK